jgi:hypothetical protein
MQLLFHPSTSTSSATHQKIYCSKYQMIWVHTTKISSPKCFDHCNTRSGNQKQEYQHNNSETGQKSQSPYQEHHKQERLLPHFPFKVNNQVLNETTRGSTQHTKYPKPEASCIQSPNILFQNTNTGAPTQQ